MRVSIISDVDLIPISNGIWEDNTQWWFVKGGFKGWYGSPQPRESGTPIPQQDGDYWPSRFTQGGRTLTIKGQTPSQSSVENAEKVRRLCNLASRELTILVEDESGRKQATGFIADNVEETIWFSRDRIDFTLIIYCPDPHKYGDWVSYPASDASFTVENAGDVPSWPLLRASGCSSLSVWFGSQRVDWSGPASPLVLDFASMIPSQGVVSYDDAFRIPPGMSEVGVSLSGGSAQLSVRPAWR